MIRSGPDVDALLAAARDGGLPVHVVPAAGDLAGSLAAFGTALALPSWFGRNLDALLDALRDLPGPAALLWAGTAPLRTRDPVAYQAIRAVLAQADAERADLDIAIG